MDLNCIFVNKRHEVSEKYKRKLAEITENLRKEINTHSRLNFWKKSLNNIAWPCIKNDRRQKSKK
jgi:hypothetical protein